MASHLQTKELVWPKLTEWPDRRSPVDSLPFGRWRYTLNAWSPEPGKLGRRPGWRKYGHDMRVTDNSDLWSKLNLDPIETLYTHESPSGTRRLFAGSKTALYCQSADGRWRTLGAQKRGKRPSFASLNEIVVSSNDEDEVVYHVIDQQAGASGKAFQAIPQLSDIGLSKAGVVFQWKGVVWLLNVVMDGVRVGHRAVWSNVNDALGWVPSTDSIAGFQDLTPGTTNLGAVALGDSMFILSSGSIWRVTYVGGDTGFGFTEVHQSDDGSGCLRTRMAIATYTSPSGVKEVYYSCADGLWKLDSYSAGPVRPEWIWRSAPALSEIGDDNCGSVCMAVNAAYEELWVSYPETGTSNTRTVVFNLGEQYADELDHGFAAMLDAQVDTRELVYEWMERAGGCSSAAIDSLWPLVNEQARPTVAASAGLPCSDENFFPSCPECRPRNLFLMVSTSDGCIKQFDPEVYGRQQRVNGAYTFESYATRLLAGCSNFGKVSANKRIQRVVLDYKAKPAADPQAIRLTVWRSGFPSDPMDDGCYTKPTVLSAKTMECPSVEPAPSKQAVRSPNSHFKWELLADARYLTLDLEIASCVGGGVDFSRLALMVGESPVSTP